MPPPSTSGRAVERLTRLCRGDGDERSLRLAVLDELRQVVPFDAYAWLLTDPESEVGCAPLADVPCLPELPRLVRLKYLTAVNRWTGLDRRAQGLRAATGNEPERSLVWRDLLARYDVDDVASLVLRDRFGCWGFLDLWRIGSGKTFTAEELELLTAVGGAVTEALRRRQAGTFALAPANLNRAGPIVLILSPELEVRVQTPETEDFLRALLPAEPDRPAIPAGAYNVAAQLLAVEAGVDHHSPVARVHLATGTWLTMRAARIGGPEHPPERDIAVSIEPSSPAERTAVFVRACGLSTREAELVVHLSAGADTRQLAQLMFLSENTIQDHLKSIFAKTGVRNRRTLLARATGR